jgi:hypothetical protein
MESEPDRRAGTAPKADGRRKAVGFNCSALLFYGRHAVGARPDTYAFGWPLLNR